MSLAILFDDELGALAVMGHGLHGELCALNDADAGVMRVVLGTVTPSKPRRKKRLTKIGRTWR